MPIADLGGHRVDVNEEGFLTDATQWTMEVAEAIASEMKITLTSG